MQEIFDNLMVKSVLQKRERKIRKHYRDYYLKRVDQIQDCHGWLLTLHYRAINRLKEKYGISRGEFIVLLACYMYLKATGSAIFSSSDLSRYLMDWHHNHLYKKLTSLINKGYINRLSFRVDRKVMYKISYQPLLLTIRAFRKHFWDCYHEFEEGVGEVKDKPSHFFDS